MAAMPKRTPMETYACVSVARVPCILEMSTDLEGLLADFGGLDQLGRARGHLGDSRLSGKDDRKDWGMQSLDMENSKAIVVK